MGTDITTIMERHTDHGWVRVDGPPAFKWRSYGLFGFLGLEHRNYACVPPISAPRDLPADMSPDPDLDFDDLTGRSWLTLAELQEFDYDVTFEDRRGVVEVRPGVFDGAGVLRPGGGEVTTIRDFLGPLYFDELTRLAALGVERVVFGFT